MSRSGDYSRRSDSCNTSPPRGYDHPAHLPPDGVESEGSRGRESEDESVDRSGRGTTDGWLKAQPGAAQSLSPGRLSDLKTIWSVKYLKKYNLPPLRVVFKRGRDFPLRDDDQVIAFGQPHPTDMPPLAPDHSRPAERLRPRNRMHPTGISMPVIVNLSWGCEPGSASGPTQTISQQDESRGLRRAVSHRHLRDCLARLACSALAPVISKGSLPPTACRIDSECALRSCSGGISTRHDSVLS